MAAIFLAINKVGYYDQVYDPMYLANGSRFDISDGITFYWATKSFSVMVCKEQHQICNPSSGNCTAFSGQTSLLPSSTAIRTLRLNSAQKAAATRVWESVAFGGQIYQTVNDLGPQGLQAQNLVKSGGFFSGGLPSNQWQIEVSRWLEVFLAKLQAYMLDWVDHSWVRGHEQYVKVRDPRNSSKESLGLSRDDQTAEQQQCRNQVIRSSGAVQNFSVAGIIIIVVVSCSIIIIGVLLEPCMRQYRKWSNSQSGIQKDLAREADHQNMLLNLALERAGSKAVWELGSFGIPITKDIMHAPLPERRPDGLVGYRFFGDDKRNASATGS